MTYAAGTKIRLVSNPAFGHRDVGEIFTAAEPLKGRRCRDNPQFYTGRDGRTTWCPAEYWELAGPVVTETVTKTRIVPGVYDRIRVTGSMSEVVEVGFDNHINGTAVLTADQLDAAAAVLSALAKGLRDVG